MNCEHNKSKHCESEHNECEVLRVMCERCGKNHATVYVTRVINGKETREMLCRACAGDVWSFDSLDLNKLFSAGVGGRRTSVCENCGRSLAEFNSSGRLGCSQCYQSFAEQLAPVINRFHGAKRHVGKVRLPGGGISWQDDPKLAEKHYQRLALQKQLDELVSLERFEDAAGVRDDISRLDEEIRRMMAEMSDKGQSAKDQTAKGQIKDQKAGEQ